MRYYLAAFFITVIFILPWFALTYPGALNSLTDTLSNEWNQLAAVIVVHNPKTIAGLQSTYNIAAPKGIAKIRILVVPGHEPDFGGAEYGSLKEREMTVELAQDLMGFLNNDPHYQVFTTRDQNVWNPIFASYFKNDWNDIVTWEDAHKTETENLIRLGELDTTTPAIIHADAPDDVAMRLYGIDKWSNENNIDIMIHIHFNDYPRGDQGSPGKYTGFAIYVPQKDYSNSSTTAAVADSVYKRLAKYNPVSNLHGESTGIVPDQDLIAVGSFNSVDAASMLIEYGYIYEPQFTNPNLRPLALKDLAYQTYLGLQDFFDPTTDLNLARSYDTLLLPHNWNSPITAKNTSSTEVYALQTALVTDGVYPPQSVSFNDCPRTGKLGPCTLQAVSDFQKDMSITGETGKVGPKTINALNLEFGVKAI